MNITIWWTDRIKAKPQHDVFLPFVQAMANRLIQGFTRYGPPDPEKKYMTRMKLELTAYRRTGNMEHLYNIANYCVLEAAAPENKKFHFDGTAESVTRSKLGGQRE